LKVLRTAEKAGIDNNTLENRRKNGLF